LPNATVARGSAGRQRDLQAAAGARAPVGAESSVSSSLSAGVGPRAGVRAARRVRAGRSWASSATARLHAQAYFVDASGGRAVPPVVPGVWRPPCLLPHGRAPTRHGAV